MWGLCANREHKNGSFAYTNILDLTLCACALCCQNVVKQKDVKNTLREISKGLKGEQRKNKFE